MSRSWAIGDVDLHLDVDGTRVRGALERTLRDALRGGRLPPGTRLPSSRALARDLGLARNTVAAAYAQLVAEGWLEGRQGAGTRVALHPASGPPAPSAPPPPRAPQFDLRPGVPDLDVVPAGAWLAAARRALRDAPFDALGYGDPRGRIELRRALAEYLARARGVAASPERIVVCTGLVQGLHLVRCRAGHAPGRWRSTVTPRIAAGSTRRRSASTTKAPSCRSSGRPARCSSRRRTSSRSARRCHRGDGVKSSRGRGRPAES